MSLMGHRSRNVMFYWQHFTFHWKLLVTVFDGPEVGESAGVKNGIVAPLLFFSVMAKVILMNQDNTKVILH